MRRLLKLVWVLAVVHTLAFAQISADVPAAPQRTQAPSYWVDPSTSLMWTAKDNGKNIDGHKAIKYCHNLNLAGYSDWRLPNQVELQGIFDKNANSPGFAGYSNKSRPFTWHVKGNLFLTGDQWSSEYRKDDRGKNSGYSWFFNFNEGRADNDPTGWPYSDEGMRALCVRNTVNAH